MVNDAEAKIFITRLCLLILPVNRLSCESLMERSYVDVRFRGKM